MRIEIPDHWSAQQAQAVLDILYDLECAIWRHYTKPLTDLARANPNEPLDHDIDLDDDNIPF